MKLKIQLCSLLAIAGLWAGCASHEYSGAAAENDHDVLTGGPVTGTRLRDLPSPVKKTLSERVPNAEIADINKTTRYGETVYVFTFTQPVDNPSIAISKDGRLLDVQR